MPPPAGAAAVPWTASGGFTFGSPGEGFFRLEAGIDSPGLSEIAQAGWFASISVIWTPGRATSIGRRRAVEILDEAPRNDAGECDVLSATADPLPVLQESPSAPPRNLLAAPPLPPATAESPPLSSHQPPAPKPGARPCLTPRQTDIYVDFFVKADYQLDRGTQPGTGLSSTLLHLTYADGTEIDVDFREIDEHTVDTPTFRRQVHNARVGPGNRLFPERMNRRTTPRLWEEKRKALVIIDEETLGFIDLGLTGVMTVLPIPAGGLRPAPGVAGPKFRVRSAPRPTGSSPHLRSPNPRAGAGRPASEPRTVTPEELRIHVAPDREPPAGVAGGSRAGKPFTRAGKDTVRNANAAAHDGRTTCIGCGRPTSPARQSRPGVRPPGDETHVDHVIPKSKHGNGSPDNGQVLCRDCNLKKGAR